MAGCFRYPLFKKPLPRDDDGTGWGKGGPGGRVCRMAETSPVCLHHCSMLRQLSKKFPQMKTGCLGGSGLEKIGRQVLGLPDLVCSKEAHRAQEGNSSQGSEWVSLLSGLAPRSLERQLASFFLVHRGWETQIVRVVQE